MYFNHLVNELLSVCGLIDNKMVLSIHNLLKMQVLSCNISYKPLPLETLFTIKFSTFMVVSVRFLTLKLALC